MFITILNFGECLCLSIFYLFINLDVISVDILPLLMSLLVALLSFCLMNSLSAGKEQTQMYFLAKTIFVVIVFEVIIGIGLPLPKRNTSMVHA